MLQNRFNKLSRRVIKTLIFLLFANICITTTNCSTMSSQPQAIGRIAIEYLDRFPNTPSLTLARIMFQDHPLEVMSIEHARAVIRYYRQSLGREKRAKISDKHKRHLRKFTKDSFNPFDFPDSDAEDFPPFILPERASKLLILADIHCPYHDVEGLTLATREAKRRNVNAILINGDAIDFHSLSRYVKNPRARNFKEELNALAILLLRLQDALGCEIFYKLGNHEERYETYMKIKAPEIFGEEAFELENLLFNRGVKATFIGRQIVHSGKLAIIHGHEFFGRPSNAVNPARGLFTKAKQSAVTAHYHRTSEHTETTLDSEIITCWSMGCMCGLWPDYAQINNWNLGFAINHITDKQGNFNFDNKRIYEGRIL